jgi:hypothetical protein
MKPKLSKILKDLRAERESIYGRRFANQSTPLDLMRLAGEKKGTGWFFSFAKDPDDTNKEQLSHEESFHDERT